MTTNDKWLLGAGWCGLAMHILLMGYMKALADPEIGLLVGPPIISKATYLCSLGGILAITLLCFTALTARNAAPPARPAPAPDRRRRKATKAIGRGRDREPRDSRSTIAGARRA